MFTINCGGCGKSSRTELWIETAIGQARPREHFQCPLCATAFVRKQEPATLLKIDDKEMVIPGEITLVRIEPVHRYESGIKYRVKK